MIVMKNTWSNKDTNLVNFDLYHVYLSPTNFFPRTAKLWNSLPIEYFLLTYDLSDFKSRINRHLLTVGSF